MNNPLDTRTSNAPDIDTESQTQMDTSTGNVNRIIPKESIYSQLTNFVLDFLKKQNLNGEIIHINEKIILSSIYTNYKFKTKFVKYSLKTILARTPEERGLAVDQFDREKAINKKLFNDDCLYYEIDIPNTEEALYILLIKWRKGIPIRQFLEYLDEINTFRKKLSAVLTFLEKIFIKYSDLKQNQIVHRDLNPNNILIANIFNHESVPDMDFDIEIIDFGASEVTTDDLNLAESKLIIPEHFRPLFYQNKQFSSVTGDIAAIGFNLLCMLSHLKILYKINPDSLTEIFPSEYTYDNKGYIEINKRIGRLAKLNLMINRDIFIEETEEDISQEPNLILLRSITILTYKMLAPELTGLDTIDKVMEEFVSIYLQFQSHITPSENSTGTLES